MIKVPQIEKRKKVGYVYEIYNLKDRRSFIGSTVYLKARINNIAHQLRHNKYPNKLLQEDFNKWGEEFFEARVVMEIPYNPQFSLVRTARNAEKKYRNATRPYYNKFIPSAFPDDWKDKLERPAPDLIRVSNFARASKLPFKTVQRMVVRGEIKGVMIDDTMFIEV